VDKQTNALENSQSQAQLPPGSAGHAMKIPPWSNPESFRSSEGFVIPLYKCTCSILQDTHHKFYTVVDLKVT
jgi:hypothetical protein